MEKIGITTDEVIVVIGISKLYFQEGLPLSIIFDEMIKRKLMPSWPHLYEELKQNGMNHKRIIHLLHEHMFESYGGEFRDEVIKRLSVD